jgi:autotransporter-associated beta strand protein
MRFIPLASTFLLVAANAQAGSNVKSLGKQFRKLDANRDESLSMSEFAKLLPAKLTRNNPLVETQVTMFDWFDEDASEDIDLGEWIEAKTANGLASPDFTEEVKDELDANGNGKLTWKEFSRVIPKYVSAKTARGWFDLSNETSYSYSGSFDTVSFGFGSITLVGPDTLISVGNTFTGSTLTVQGGLSGATVASVTNISGSIAFTPDSNSSLTLAPSDSSTTLTFPSGVTLDDSSSGGTSAVGDLTKTGSGTLTLDSANTFTGSTTVFGGSLSIVEFGGFDTSAQTGTYNLFDFVTGTGNFDVVTIDGNSLTYNAGTDE